MSQIFGQTVGLATPQQINVQSMSRRGPRGVYGSELPTYKTPGQNAKVEFRVKDTTDDNKFIVPMSQIQSNAVLGRLYRLGSSNAPTPAESLVRAEKFVEDPMIQKTTAIKQMIAPKDPVTNAIKDASKELGSKAKVKKQDIVSLLDATSLKK